MVVLLATSDVIGRKMGEPKISEGDNSSIQPKETSAEDKNDTPDDEDAGVVTGTFY